MSGNAIIGIEVTLGKYAPISRINTGLPFSYSARIIAYFTAGL
jgi:hypothetical protein